MIRLTPTSEKITVEYDVTTTDLVPNQRPQRFADLNFSPTEAAVAIDCTDRTYVVELTGPCPSGRPGWARYAGRLNARPAVQIVGDVVAQVVRDFDLEPLP